ncbi:hypothetical protein GCM10027286_01020 [Virgibacillus ainsalahensis]
MQRVLEIMLIRKGEYDTEGEPNSAGNKWVRPGCIFLMIRNLGII